MTAAGEIVEGPGSEMVDDIRRPGERPDAATQIAGLVFAMMLIDPDMRIVEVNHAAENLLGKSAKRLIGERITEALGPLDRRVYDRLNTSDAALVARDIYVLTGESETRVNLTVSPLPSHQGWRALTLSEISHEESPDDAGPQSGTGAPSILAHEIKNPLAAIRGGAQLVARKLPLADKKLARMITDEVDRIARLIDRMQQLGSSKSEPAEPCNLHEAIRSAVATVRAGGSHQTMIREEFDPSLPPVLANRDALEQVLINLVSNACDAAASGEDEAEVIVRTRFVSGLAFSAIKLGRAVRLPIEITVSDNGPGIDPKLRNHVFEPFVTSKKSGQGLGLALARKLVRDMDGNISHERDLRKGLTHFRIHLPQGSSPA